MKISILLIAAFIFHAYSADTYKNPTQEFRDSPDPGVVFDGSYFYASTTGGWDSNFFPVWQSIDLTNWKQVGWGILK